MLNGGDMMYTLYLSPLGEVVLHFATIQISGFYVYISGYDEDRNRIDFVMDKLQYPDDSPYDCGYCHIISYAMQGVTTPCNIYRSIC